MARTHGRSKRSCLFAFVLFGIYALTSYIGRDTHVESHSNEDPARGPHRQLLQYANNCSRASDEFPPDFMTDEQKQNGGIIFHILVSLYIMAVLAIICDDYFVAALEAICNVLHVQSDVAGATFMAAGSSAPELFTAIIGVFFAKSDVGVGTVVGSAVFNLLFNLSLCAVFSGMVIKLTWWPVLRDMLCYTISVSVLIAIMSDNTIYWYESLIMVLLYISYIVLMYFNPRLGNFVISKVNAWKDRKTLMTEKSPLLPNYDDQDHFLMDSSQSGVTEQSTSISTRCTRSISRQITEISRQISRRDDVTSQPEYESAMTFPESIGSRIFWILMLPANVVLFLTIPDCTRPGCWKKMYIATFFACIIWIGATSYVLVWMVTIIGETFGIPDAVMGLTLLAVGNSIPDAIASLFVAKDGFGEMAVSNCIGSNVFDILLGLGLPWFIKTAMVDPNTTVAINSEGLFFSAVILLATIVFLVVVIFANGWKLTRPIGVLLFAAYVVVTVLSCLYVLGIFGGVAAPIC